MMIAIELLSKLFTQNSYAVTNFTLNNFRCFFASSRFCSDYYVIVDKEFFEDEDVVYLKTTGVQELHAAVKKMENFEPGVDKNTILVVCIPDHLEMLDEMARIEEDAYTFKKNIIRYSFDSIKQLYEKLEGNLSSPNLSSHLFQVERFDSMKSQVSCDYYRLLVNLYIKLPMLTVDNQKVKKLKNIQEKIQSRTSKDNLAELLEATQKIKWSQVESYEDISDLCSLLNEV